MRLVRLAEDEIEIHPWATGFLAIHTPTGIAALVLESGPEHERRAAVVQKLRMAVTAVGVGVFNTAVL